MYVLQLLVILVSIFYATALNVVDHENQYYLLPLTIKPILYDLKLFLDPNNAFNFAGEVSIRATAINRTSEIVMHAMEMDIARETLEVLSETHNTPLLNLAERFTLATDDTHFLRITLSRELEIDEIVNIHIKYTSQYSTNMFGVYVRTYMSQGMLQNFLTTQFQPTFARSAFPCFDEPRFKAIFRTTIYAPPSYNVVLSNMPLREDSLQKEVPGWTKHEFEDTPIMSTYLQGYHVSNFGYIENDMSSQDSETQIVGVSFRVYSRPDTQDSAIFAQNFTQQSLFYINRLFDRTPYPIAKLDKIAVPDFAPEAVGNWGFSIFREETLLVRDGVTSTIAKNHVARTISHENALLWFGNDVTPASWKYLWMSEGLASFYSLFSTSIVEWTLNPYNHFLLEVQNVFQLDATLGVKPVTYPVYTPSEILKNYNAITSTKAGALMYMLNYIVRPIPFRRGIDLYLQAKSRGTVEPDDLYAQIQTAAFQDGNDLPFSIKTIMDSWVNQPGFPVLSMVRSGNLVTVTQERFLNNGVLNATANWYIPLNWATASKPEFYETRPLQWVTPEYETRFNIPDFDADNDWFIFNIQQTGYYRVNYDEDNWKALTKQLFNDSSVINVFNRAGLLDDAFNLARSGRLHYNITLDLSRYLSYEEDYAPFAAVNSAFNYLDLVLSGTRAYPLYQRYIHNITERTYLKLGFEDEEWETTEQPSRLVRPIVLDLNCRHTNGDCMSKVGTIMKNLQTNSDQNIHPDAQTVVYCSSLRDGNEDNFNYLWNMFLGSTDSSQRAMLINALGCTTNAYWRNFYLSQAVIVNSNVRDQDRYAVIMSVINSGPQNINAALEVVVENFGLLHQRIRSLNGVTNILMALAGKLTTQAHANRVDELIRRHHSILTVADWEAITAIRENIAASIAWRAQHAATVEAWLQDNYGNNATALTSSLILLISIFAVLFNQ